MSGNKLNYDQQLIKLSLENTKAMKVSFKKLENSSILKLKVHLKLAGIPAASADLVIRFCHLLNCIFHDSDKVIQLKDPVCVCVPSVSTTLRISAIEDISTVVA